MTHPELSPSLTQTVHAAVLRGDYAAAERLLLAAIEQQSPTPELQRALAGVYRQTGRDRPAESLLLDVLKRKPDDLAAAFGLARLYRDQARFRAAASILRESLAQGQHDAEAAIEASRLLIECDREEDAAAIIADALGHAPEDPRLQVRAAMLSMQLGAFDQARTHYLRTLEHPAQACEWHVPHGMAHAQRYVDAKHPDFARFLGLLELPSISAKARASLRFALGKAYDDVGDYAAASMHFREANALARGTRQWTRKHWRRAVAALMSAKPIHARVDVVTEFTPILMVGMPRCGSTLLAKLLSRDQRICNRGELPWLGLLMQAPALAESPTVGALREASTAYAKRLRRDDSDARWFIDKQPFNFRYVDTFMAMFPQARVIYCRRSPRDAALSLWTQSFSDEIQGYACDFADIAAVMHDCDRLMTRWQAFHPDAIRSVSYESLVTDPDGVTAGLAAWLGVPQPTAGDGHLAPETNTSIGTASLWQARQPVHTRSIARWRSYAPYVPELMNFAAVE